MSRRGLALCLMCIPPCLLSGCLEKPPRPPELEGAALEGEGEDEGFGEGEGEGFGEGEGLGEGEGEGVGECTPLASELCGPNQGECVAGQRSCDAAGQWGECTGGVGPAAEQCDGLDNDCDGGTDEGLDPPAGCELTQGECRGTEPECRGAAGWQCEYPLTWEEVEQSCDGLDNDCDGEVDVADPDVVIPAASLHVGVCAGQKKVCGGAAGWQEPDYSIIEGYQANEAFCDGRDNDCDGKTDEELNPPLADQQEGVCAGSRQICAGAGGWQEPDFTEIQGYQIESETRCDDRDNDCDGDVDEELAGCIHCDGSGNVPCNGCPAGTVVPAGWACIPAGTWTLGSPAEETGRRRDETQHQVELTYSFLLQLTEVTQAEWMAAMGSNPSHFRVGDDGGCYGDPCESRPVEDVTWFKAVAYCNSRAVAEGLEPCYQDAGGAIYDAADAAAEVEPTWPEGLSCSGYRLPTEAEWEIAARAGTATATPAGNLDADHLFCEQPNPILDGIAWFCGNSEDRTHPVARLAANAWGLHDMLGNVFEWCWDRYGAYQAGPLSDPMGPEGSDRVVRGGAWANGAMLARSANRFSFLPGNRWSHVGFRLVRSVP